MAVIFVNVLMLHFNLCQTFTRFCPLICASSTASIASIIRAVGAPEFNCIDKSTVPHLSNVNALALVQSETLFIALTAADHFRRLTAYKGG